MTGLAPAGAGVARAGAGLACGLVLLLAAAVSATTAPDCAAPVAPSDASAAAERTIPAAYLTLYQQAGRAYTVPWTVLAAIGKIETDHGRSTAPGVHSGVNAFGCCAGPMQFNLSNGPPSTWQAYRVDGDSDGDTDPYDPADAIASAAHYLNALLKNARGDLAAAVYGYNHSRAYVADVLARARTYSDTPETALVAPADQASAAACTIAPVAGEGPANLQGGRAPHPATRLRHAAERGRWPPGAPPNRSTPACSTTPSGCCAPTACASPPPAKAATTRTATAPPLDLVPAEPVDQAAWDASRRRARARPRLDARLRRLRHPARMPARARDPLRRLRGLPRPRLTPHLQRHLPRAPAHLLGLAVLRHQRPVGPVRVGDGMAERRARPVRHGRRQRLDRHR